MTNSKFQSDDTVRLRDQSAKDQDDSADHEIKVERMNTRRSNLTTVHAHDKTGGRHVVDGRTRIGGGIIFGNMIWCSGVDCFELQGCNVIRGHSHYRRLFATQSSAQTSTMVYMYFRRSVRRHSNFTTRHGTLVAKNGKNGQNENVLDEPAMTSIQRTDVVFALAYRITGSKNAGVRQNRLRMVQVYAHHKPAITRSQYEQLKDRQRIPVPFKQSRDDAVIRRRVINV